MRPSPPPLPPPAPTRQIAPLGRPVDARIAVPGSKSLTNRALICAALAGGLSAIDGALVSDDTARMVQALQDLGYGVEFDPVADAGVCRIEGAGRGPAGRAEIDVGASGTCMRFLTALAAAGSGETLLRGTERMHERPIGELVEALRGLGAQIECRQGGYPPVRVRGRGLEGGQVEIPGTTSSQFLSALLMAAPAARSAVIVRVTGELVSRPFVEMTRQVMRAFGVETEHRGEDVYHVEAPQSYVATAYAVEGDATAASYFLAAAAICGGRCRITNLGGRSVQGDAQFAEKLKLMGCAVEVTDEHVEVSRDPETPLTALPAAASDFNPTPDLVQTLAAVAPFARGTTRIANVANLRVKETDRLAAIATELARLGAVVEEGPDSLVIAGDGGASLHGARVRTYDDHRMAMSLALIGLRVSGVLIENPACVNKTFPTYWDVLGSL